ncbi:hypothetical protein HDU97_005084 [Phlyctochytrium planicorne]|nr:hypothetical protein HDU97_005084 [Phlyctochytrium planicorne]
MGKRHISDVETAVPLPTTFADKEATVKEFRQAFSRNHEPLPPSESKLPYRFYQVTLRRGLFGLPMKTRAHLKALGFDKRHEVVWAHVNSKSAGLILKVKEIVDVKLVNSIPKKIAIPKGYAPIVLGSSSKSRASILNLANIPFTVQVADIDEKAIGSRGPGSDPDELVTKIARAKADALLASGKVDAYEDAFLITCDQVGLFNGMWKGLTLFFKVALWEGQIREKPVNEEEARSYLKSYSLAPAETRGAMVVINLKTKKRAEGIDVAKQYFKPIPESVIDALIKQGDVYYCCGAFMIDDPLLIPYLDKREGDEDSIIGLSKRLLVELLSKLGFISMELLRMAVCVLLWPLYIMSLGFSGGIIIFSVPFVALEILVLALRGLASLIISRLSGKGIHPYGNKAYRYESVSTQEISLVSPRDEGSKARAMSESVPTGLETTAAKDSPSSTPVRIRKTMSKELLPAVSASKSMGTPIIVADEVKPEAAAGSAARPRNVSPLSTLSSTGRSLTALDFREATNFLSTLGFDDVEPENQNSQNLKKSTTPSYVLERPKRSEMAPSPSPVCGPRSVRASSAPMIVSVPSMMPYIGDALDVLSMNDGE